MLACSSIMLEISEFTLRNVDGLMVEYWAIDLFFKVFLFTLAGAYIHRPILIYLLKGIFYDQTIINLNFCVCYGIY